MAFNFPASPANGASYTPVGGPVFTWDGTAWKALSQGMPVTVFVGDVAPTAPAFGNLWWESDTGNLYIYYNDGDSAQWVQINGTPAGYQTADSRNRIVNGGLQISQENAFGTVASVNASYVIDMWAYGFVTSGAPQCYTTDASGDGRLLRVNAGSTIDTSIAAGDYLSLSHKTEGSKIADFLWGTAYAKPAVLRFTARCTIVPSLTVGVSLRTIPTGYAFVKNVTLTGAWQEFVIPIPAPTVGTWPTDSAGALLLSFSGMAGSTYIAPTENAWIAGSFIATAGIGNQMAVASTAMDIRNVALYLDPDNTGVAPKWQMPDEAEELRACQRYWQKSQQFGGIFSGNVTAAISYNAVYPLPVVMRVKPDVSGVTSNQTASFPSATGALAAGAQPPQQGTSVLESRVASATANAAFFHSIITASARM